MKTLRFCAIALVCIMIWSCGDTSSPTGSDPTINLAFRITYTAGDSIFHYDPALEGSIVLATGFRQFDGSMAWSPDGRYLAYTHVRGVMIVDSDGQQITEIPISQIHRFNDLSWNSTGDYLLFSSYGEGIYFYDVGLDDLTLIHRSQGFVYDHNGSFSPNDEYIAWVTHSRESYLSLQIMNIEDGTSSTIIQGVRTASNEHPDISWIASDQIVFKAQRTPKGIRHITLPDTDTLVSAELVLEREFDRLRTASDQVHFAFSNRDSLFIGNTNDWTATPLAVLYALHDFTWSPDGDLIVCLTDNGVYAVDLDGNAHFVIARSKSPGVIDVKL